MAPTMGCTMSPERGPAIHTSEVLLLVRPSDSRYGVQSVIGSSWLISPSGIGREYWFVSHMSVQCPRRSCMEGPSDTNSRNRGTCATYDIPMVLQVNRNIRMDSVLPLIEGWPSHRDISPGA